MEKIKKKGPLCAKLILWQNVRQCIFKFCYMWVLMKLQVKKSFAYQIMPFQTAHGQNCSSPGGWGDSMWFPRSL